MAVSEINGNLCSTNVNLNYLNLSLPDQFNIFPVHYLNIDSFSSYYVKEVLKAERRKIKNTVNWLDVDESSFGLLFKDMLVKRTNKSFKWIVAQQIIPASTRDPSFLFSKIDWCAELISEFYEEFKKGKNSPSYLLLFLRIIEILEYKRYIRFNTIFMLLEMFYNFVPENPKISQLFASEIKKAFLVNNIFLYTIFRYCSMNFRLPFNKTEMMSITLPLGVTKNEKETLYMITQPKVINLLIRYGFTNNLSIMELTGLPMSIFLAEDDIDQHAPGYDARAITDANPLKKYQEEKMPERLKHRIFQVLYLYKLRTSIDDQLRLLWDTIPDPYLVLDDFLPPSIKAEDSACNYVTDIYEWYKTVVGVQCSKKTPRTLLHLSKWAIRSRLADNLALPEGVYTLTVKAYGTPQEKIIPLPRLLKHYLLLFDLNFEYDN